MLTERLTIEFPVDFETKKIGVLPLGRLLLGEATVLRLYMTPKGLMAYISTSKEAKDVIINYIEDSEIEFAGE